MSCFVTAGRLIEGRTMQGTFFLDQEITLPLPNSFRREGEIFWYARIESKPINNPLLTQHMPGYNEDRDCLLVMFKSGSALATVGTASSTPEEDPQRILEMTEHWIQEHALCS